MPPSRRSGSRSLVDPILTFRLEARHGAGLPAALTLALTLGLTSCGDSPTGLYSPPAGDWPVATPAEQGLAEQPLLDLKTEIAFGVYGDVHSVLIVRNGQLVFEEYFREGARDELHRVYSVTKSVAATLVGIAWDRGLISDLDQPLLDFFPEYDSVENPAGKDAITLRHALQMRTGIEWDEWDTNYDSPDNVTSQMARSSDWMKFVLDRPMSAAPGTVFAYNSGVSNLLAGVIRRVTGETTYDFADEVLLEPLGIMERSWSINPDTVAITGWGLHLRSRDMARIGQLYLQRGVWNGQRLLSEAWIDATMEPATRVSSGWGYGYQWWLGPPADGDRAGRRVPSAQGWGGQFIVVVPSLDAVIVATQGNYGGLEGLDPERLLEVLIEAAAGAAAS